MADRDIEPGPRSDADLPIREDVDLVTKSVDALSDNVDRLRQSFDAERSDNRKVLRRQRIKLALVAVALVAVAVLAVVTRRQNQQIISDRAVARVNACITWNGLVDVVRAGDVNNAEALISVATPSPDRVLTPEQQAQRDAFIKAYRAAVATGIPASVYRDCSPEGIRAFYEAKRPEQLPPPVTGTTS